VVIANPGRVSVRRLLVDARWRETAVVLLQTANATDADAICAEATALLQERDKRYDKVPCCEQERRTDSDDFNKTPAHNRDGIRWSSGTLHILGILQAGFGGRAATIPESIKTLSAGLLGPAFQYGNLLDRKFALEVAGTLPQEALLEFIRSSLTIDSQWLNDVIYYQIARLSEIPTDILSWIRGAILRWALTGQLARNWHGVQAHLMRLHGATQLIKAARLARWIVPLDLAAWTGLVVGITWCVLGGSPSGKALLVSLTILASTLLMIKIYWIYWMKLGPTSIITRIVVIFYAVLISVISWRIEIDSSMFIIIFISYFAIWGPAAAKCVNEGLFTSVAHWPLTPLIFIVNLYKGIKNIVPYFREHLNGIFSFAKFIVLRAILASPILYFRSLWIVMPISFGVINVGIMGVPFVWSLMIIGRDCLLLRSFHLDSHSVLDAQTLISHYNRLTSGIWRLSLLRRVRGQNSLLQNEESEQAVRLLLHDIEQRYASDKVKQTKEVLTYRLMFRRFCTNYTRFFRGNIFPRLGEQRDELYALLESLTRERIIGFLGRTSDADVLERAGNRVVSPASSP
jgi:hypothetical protein